MPGTGGFIGKARLEGGAGHGAVIFPAAGHGRTEHYTNILPMATANPTCRQTGFKGISLSFQSACPASGAHSRLTHRRTATRRRLADSAPLPIAVPGASGACRNARSGTAEEMDADLSLTIARRIGCVPAGLREQGVDCPGWNSIGIRYRHSKKIQLAGRPSPSQVNFRVPCQIGGNPMSESCSSPRSLGPAFGHAPDRTSLPGRPDRRGETRSWACTRESGRALEPLQRRGREGEVGDLPAGMAEPVADCNAQVAAALEKAARLDFGMLRRKLAEKMNRSVGYLNEVEGLYCRFLALDFSLSRWFTETE